MRLYAHSAEQDFRDGGEVWLHWTPAGLRTEHVQLELMREFLEDIMKELDRLRTFEDLMMKADEFEADTNVSIVQQQYIIENFIVFATES